jgi:5'-3' exonuclease
MFVIICFLCKKDLAKLKPESVKLHFEMDKPFSPFQQLLAVLPPASKHLLPKALQGWLM